MSGNEGLGARASRIALDRDRLAEFCRRRHIVELALFGSVSRDDFRLESDVDVLVRFAPDAHYGLFDLVHIQDEMSELLGRSVDLVEREAVERSENYIRHRHVLGNLEQVYVA